MLYTEDVRRTQIYLEKDLDRRLRETAAAEGRSAAAVIREALRRYLSGGTATARDPILAMVGVFTGLPSDAAAEHDRDLYRSTARRSGRRR
jgi:plasmid stability protein